jgi:fermentation-respiration switch protein FrsA (DUF1100 family)
MTNKRKIFAINLFLLVSVFLLFNVYLYSKQPGMIFYPLKEVDVTPDEWDLPYQPVQIKSTDHVKLSAWYIPHPEANKTVLFFHGNGGNISHRGDSIYIFHKLKMNVLIIDYPGYGESEGIPSEDGLYQSANSAWQYLIKDKNIKPKNIIIYGRSLGGAVAIDLASRVKAGGLILESTFSSVADIVKMAFPVMSNFIYLRYSFDSLSKINKVKYPVLLIHSPDDEIIPFELGQKLFAAVQSEKKFLQIEGGHNDGFMQSISSYMQTLRSYFQSLP